LCFLDESTSEIAHRIQGRGENWLGQLAAYVNHREIGAVGGLIVDHERSVVISAGRAIDGDGSVADLGYGESTKSAGYFARLLGSSNCTAVRLGCLVMRRDVFNEIGDLDQQIPDDLADVDYGLRLRGRGYRSVVLSQFHFSQLDHHSSNNSDRVSTLTRDIEYRRFLEKWSAKLPEQDPSYSPNLQFIDRSANFYLDVELPEEVLTTISPRNF
jgi:GT2 family glycosyltransferase